MASGEEFRKVSNFIVYDLILLFFPRVKASESYVFELFYNLFSA